MIIDLRRLFVSIAIGLALVAPATASTSNMLLLGAALSGDNIISVGERGTILLSDDNGGTWTKQPSPTLTTLTAVVFANDGLHGWAVGHDAIILATDDGGQTWIMVYQGANIEDSLLDICVAERNVIIAIGAYGIGVRSTDAGQTWEAFAVQDDDSHLNKITRSSDGTLYIAGERGTLLRSRNLGQTWESILSPYDGSFYGILPLSEKNLIAHGLRGHIYRSEDDGENWTVVPISTYPLLATGCLLSTNELVLAGQSRAFLISRDEGQTFESWNQTLTTGVAFLLKAPNGDVLAFGETGVAILTEP